MTPLYKAVEVHELRCVGVFTVDGESVGMDLEVEEVWSAVFEFINSELQISLEVVVLL